MSVNFIACSTFTPALKNYAQSKNIICSEKNTTGLDYTTMFIFLPEIGFNPELDYPFVNRPTYHPIIFNSIFFNVLKIPLNILYLEDDDGWLVQNKKVLMDVDMSTRDSDIMYNQNKVEFPEISLNFLIGDKFKRYKRTYVKLQDLLAVIGGFMKVVLIFLNVSVVMFRSFIIDSYLILSQFDNKVYEGKLHMKPPPCTLNMSLQGKIS
jgi:hypothetical protein